jgi:hypothetical protein
MPPLKVRSTMTRITVVKRAASASIALRADCFGACKRPTDRAAGQVRARRHAYRLSQAFA